jgi:hypothetical protein
VRVGRLRLPIAALSAAAVAYVSAGSGEMALNAPELDGQAVLEVAAGPRPERLRAVLGGSVEYADSVRRAQMRVRVEWARGQRARGLADDIRPCP